MSETPQTKEARETTAPTKDVPIIHRVCITCNGMFAVTADNYEAKHCPNCHKD